MELAIRTRRLSLSPDALAELRRRVLLVFARVPLWVRAVDVTLSDINGPRGGADKRCRVRVRGYAVRGVVVEQTGVDALATVVLAAERAEQTLVRKMARQRGFAPVLAF